MSPDDPIDRDLACANCGYNLRSLPVTHRCPECEFPVLRSYLAVVAAIPNPVGRKPLGISDRKAIHFLADLLGCHVHAVTFVRACVDIAWRGSGAPEGRVPHASAKLVCAAVRDLALAHFGGPTRAGERLRDLQLLRSEDVGRVVAALVEAGLVSPSEHDSPADFHGVFTLETLFPPSV